MAVVGVNLLGYLLGWQAALPGALFAVWCILTAGGAASVYRRRFHREAVLVP